MQPIARTKKAGVLLVATLAVATLAGHLATRKTNALPTYGAAPLSGSDSLVTLSGRLDRSSVLAGGDGQVKMELSLAAAEAENDTAGRAPVDMFVVLDRSGSMSHDGKIEAARAAVQELIGQLHDEDRLALVAFAGTAEVVIPLARATPRARAEWRQQVAGVGLDSWTNISQGLDLALDLAAGAESEKGSVRRLLLLSDGETNQGDTSVDGLTRRARQAADSRLVVSTIGVGEQFNEFLMSTLADAGTGNYYYLRDQQLATIFSDELQATRETVAQSLAVVLEPAPGVEVLDAAGYPLETANGRVTFRPGTLFAGQERRIWVTLRVPHDKPGERTLGTVQAIYTHDGERHAVELPQNPKIACVADRSDWLGGFDRATWARSVVEEDYSRLRQEVAVDVKQGRREEALRRILHYRQQNQALNETLDSSAVTSNLQELKKLEADVDDAFVGEGQAHKQNILSKTNQAAGWDNRRTGSKNSGKSPN